ncbi:hypothetical protein SanaruYs_28070 [Chryseotalea sanaruensis]|uniref:DUF4270 domain-containing protein n=1 Tax=Chryseotalea sanaruensis TaxID=2482724 RepID=A0A401UCH4_9BACT|nr:DUF4270 family protein [Chryseotalea sanaruensis]GCC52570.1 hypothetical protein SanaruYs_28070 [Chryseotalea sanaruensis]
MNLWVKRIALGLSAVVALFLFACLDDESILGFRNQNQKFKVSYIEIPIESSVLLFDSLRTSNSINDPVNRLLVGSYEDPVFGRITAEAYAQMRPSNTGRAKETGAVFDSVTMHLHLDLYNYGGSSSSEESFTIHRLTEMMSFRGGNDYYTNTSVAYDPIPLGTGSEIIKPALFNEELDDFTTADTIITTDVRLNDEFGLDLFDNWDITKKSFTDFDDFSKIFKGLAIVGNNNSKVFGISLSDSTRVALHYHTATDTLVLNYYISFVRDVPKLGLASTSKIVAERNTSSLAGLTSPYAEFTPANPNKLYIQSGVPVVTKLNFSKFLEFCDTIENLVINSAELSIGSIDEPQSFRPPQSLYLQLIDNTNRLKRYDGSKQDSLDLIFYNNKVRSLSTALSATENTSRISKSNTLGVVEDRQDRFAQLSYNSNTKSYNSFITLFMQELIEQESNADLNITKSRFTNFALYPGNPFAAKSINRISFNKENLKLKIFYTTPTQND